jgi:RHS repeat-associated protein
VLSDKVASFDALNRLESLTDSVAPTNNATFTYDNNGNQTSKTQGGTTIEYRYDIRDKLVEVQPVGAPVPTARFQYCYDGKRIKKIGEGTPGDTIRQYVYDQTSLLAEYDKDGNQKAKYDYGDRLISLFRADEGRRYFHLDGLRSVTNLTDDAGTSQASYHLDAWGEYRNPLELNASQNRFGLTGHLFDRETGLYFAKARYLDPQLGRFLTQDNFLGNPDRPPSLHRYFYANDNPIRFVDPTGHQSAELKEEYRHYFEEKKQKEERNWCAANPAACEAKKATEAQAQRAADTSVGGALRAGGGAAQLALAGALAATPEPTFLTKLLALLLAFRGGENLGAGGAQLVTGEEHKTATRVVIEEGLRAGKPKAADIERRAGAGEALLDALLGLAGLAALPAVAPGAAVEPFESGKVAPGPVTPRSAGLPGTAPPPPQRTTPGGVSTEAQGTREVVVTYRPGAGIDRTEFAKQLADQEAGINKMTAGEIRARIEQFREQGRPSSAGAAIRQARQADPAAAEGKAALHSPDCCVGGSPEAIGGFGDKSANSSLGSLNRAKQAQIYDAVKDLPPDAKVRFRFAVEEPKNR